MYVRGGTILPILQHADCPSILACIDNDITLEVYPDSANKATGTLYLDDGSSIIEGDDKKTKSARLSFKYEDATLTVTTDDDSQYEKFPIVATVVIHGIDSQPASVIGPDDRVSYEFLYEAPALYVNVGSKADAISLKISF